jgi:hypothetical protein
MQLPVGIWRLIDTRNPALLDRASAGDQIDNRHNYGNNQQQVDKAARNVKTPTEEPKDQQNGKNCPEHSSSPGPEVLAAI